MKLEAFPTSARPPEIVPGRPQRAWMDKFFDRHPYRCLPLSMANSSGWEVLCPVGFTATWNGGIQGSDLTIRPDHPFPDFEDFAKSHFTHGVLTLHTQYLFRTPEGWSMWVKGPPNHVKDGIQPLEGLVETDWLPFPFTMNWIFTRPGSVHFAKGEPFCFLTLVEDKKLEDFELVQRNLERDPELLGQYEAWRKQRETFNNRLYKRDPNAVKEAWQRFYFRGELPDDTGEAPAAHTNKRRLKPLKLGF
ncbi:MAG TPA: DUF6065 family protein [Caulobacteraceae bacterium]|nr:DUF6065 family protein [Caulobacteraceae bacterium]